MRIHSSILTATDVFDAARVAGVTVEEIERHGSRKASGAFEVKLSGSSPYAAQGGQWKAATWDEWGIFLARLFEIDEATVAGSYKGREDFERQTREAVGAARNYDRIVGKSSPRTRHVTGPWLRTEVLS